MSAKAVAALAAVVLLCFAALGFSARRDNRSFGDPRHSAFGFIARMFPQRALEPGDLRDVDCFDAAQRAFVLGPIPCAFAVPGGVRAIKARWDSGASTVRLERAASLTQTYRSTDDPQDADHPSELDMPVFGDGSVATMTCASPSCRIALR